MAVPAVYDGGVETSSMRNPKVPCRACVVRPWSFAVTPSGPLAIENIHRPSAASFFQISPRGRVLVHPSLME
jgi:hypothetical protein